MKITANIFIKNIYKNSRIYKTHVYYKYMEYMMSGLKLPLEVP